MFRPTERSKVILNIPPASAARTFTLSFYSDSTPRPAQNISTWVTSVHGTASWEAVRAHERKKSMAVGGVRILTQLFLANSRPNSLLPRTNPQAKWHVTSRSIATTWSKVRSWLLGEPVETRYDFSKADVIDRWMPTSLRWIPGVRTLHPDFAARRHLMGP